MYKKIRTFRFPRAIMSFSDLSPAHTRLYGPFGLAPGAVADTSCTLGGLACQACSAVACSVPCRLACRYLLFPAARSVPSLRGLSFFCPFFPAIASLAPTTHRSSGLRTGKAAPFRDGFCDGMLRVLPYFFAAFLSAAYSSLTLASTAGVMLSVESASISAVALMMSLYFLSPLISCTARCSRSCARLVKT